MDKLNEMMKKEREMKKKNTLFNDRMALHFASFLLMVGLILNLCVLISVGFLQLNEKLIIGLIGLSMMFIIIAVSVIMNFLISNTK